MIKTWLSFVLIAASAPAVVVAANKAATPEARLQAFTADYSRVHGRLHAEGASFRQWNAAATKLATMHFVGSGERGLSQVMSISPEYLPGDEILRTSPSGQTTRIETRAPTGASARYHEFELREVRGDWRIVRIRHYFKAVDEPFVSPDQRPRFEHPKSIALAPLGKQEDGVNRDAYNFKAGHKIRYYDYTATVEVRQVGTLNVTSGILAVGDLSYSAFYLPPLGQRIAPGQYPVEVALTSKCIAGLRVIISPQPVVSWHPAEMDDGGHSIAANIANVAITDISTLLAVNGRQVEQTLEKFDEIRGFANAQLLSLANSNDTVIWNSCFRYSGFPVYWGADASGKPAVLLVDFFMLDSQEIE